MDMSSYKVALKNALGRLPKEILETIPALVAKHLPTLEIVAPAILADMQNHFAAAMMEAPIPGMLDKDALMQATKEVLESFGIREGA